MNGLIAKLGQILGKDEPKFNRRYRVFYRNQEKTEKYGPSCLSLGRDGYIKYVPTTNLSSPNVIRSRPRKDARATFNALEEYCGTLQPGDMVPTYTELMRQLGASERAVRGALDELGRQGKIIRRNGAGTFIAEPRVDVRNDGTIVPTSITDNRTIVAIGKPDRSFFDRAMSQLFTMAEAADLSVACRLIDPATASLSVPNAGSDHPAGYVLFSHNLYPLAQQLQQAGGRVVLVGNPPADTTLGVPNVYGDHQQGGYLAAQHVIALGHRRILFYGDKGIELTRRWRGYERAIREARKAGHDLSTSVLTFSEALAWNNTNTAVREHFAGPHAPTAVVAWNDHEAISLVRMLNNAGLRVPHDITVIGYDNLPESQVVTPPLTTVDGNLEQQLQIALDLLIAPDAPANTHTTVVVPTLIRRDSSAQPAL